MICISTGDIGFEEAMEVAQSSEMIEIRVDLCNYSNEQISTLIESAKKALVTCRPGKHTDEERIDLFRMACESGCSYIDIEIENEPDFIHKIKEIVADYKSDLIVSYHNYKTTPGKDQLKSILKDCYEAGADVAKIACLVNNGEDLNNLLSLYRQKGRKVVLGMGEEGMLSRVAAIALGAEFTFASKGKGHETAPGQLTENELKEIFRILKIV